MEIKNGIIIDGVLHELCVGICDECSLQNECDDSSEIISVPLKLGRIKN